MQTLAAAPTDQAEFADFYRRAARHDLAPLWKVLGGLVTAQPTSPAVPALWAYDEVRPYLLEACKLISTEDAERRVLIFENPGLPGQSRATLSLFAGLQIILPGEIAPAHRHAASALRFIVEGDGAYTAVDGERTTMHQGDFVITPSWTWHDHGHQGEGPMVWLDGLDMHIVNLLNCSFRENYPSGVHPVVRTEGSAWTASGHNLLPIDYKPGNQTTPIFNYPYRVTRETLDQLSRSSDPDPCHGFKMRYVNPATGGSPIPTLFTAMQLLPKGFKSDPFRTTAGTVYSVVEGHGVARIGEQSFAWGPRDHFVVPSWYPLQLEAQSEAVIFSFSDRVVQEKLDLYREQRGHE